MTDTRSLHWRWPAIAFLVLVGIALIFLLMRDNRVQLPESADTIRTMLESQDADGLAAAILLVRSGPEHKNSEAWLSVHEVAADGTRVYPNSHAAGRWLEAFDFALKHSNLNDDDRNTLNASLVDRLYPGPGDITVRWREFLTHGRPMSQVVETLVTLDGWVTSLEVAVFDGRREYAEEHGLPGYPHF